MQNKAARRANRTFAQAGEMGYTKNPITEEKKWVSFAARQKCKKWNIRSFLNNVDKTVHENGVKIPDCLTKEVGVGAGALFLQMYNVAVRDNSENPKIYCPRCKRYHAVEVTAACPEHPEDFPALPCKVDNVKLEQNSLTVAMKIFDKFLPTLSSVNQTVNVQGTITTISAQLVQIIFRYVPSGERKKCMEEIDGLLGALQEENRD